MEREHNEYLSSEAVSFSVSLYHLHPPDTLTPNQFNVGYYLSINSDIQVKKPREAFDHYLQFGRKEGRRWSSSGETPPYYLDVKATLALYPTAKQTKASIWSYCVKNNLPFCRCEKITQYQNQYNLLLPDIALYHLEEIIRWTTIFGYEWQNDTFKPVRPYTASILFDFPDIGGTYFYSQCLRTRFSCIRVVAFRRKYYIRMEGNQVVPIIYTRDSLITWLKSFLPKVYFINHPMTMELDIFHELPSEPLKITILHDYEWLKEEYESFLPSLDLIIAQTKAIGRIAKEQRAVITNKLIYVPHPDYREIEASLTIPSGTPKRLGMIGAISQKKGAEELYNLLPRFTAAKIQVIVFGTLDYALYDYYPYIENNTLIVHPYNNINEFNKLLRQYTVSAFWFHNNIKFTMETWLYTLTLGQLTGLPLLLNRLPIFQERVPSKQARFYDRIEELIPAFQSLPTVNNYTTISPRISFPKWYAKLFSYDPVLLRLKQLNQLSLSETEERAPFLSYLLQPQLYYPALHELEPASYVSQYHDLKGKTEKELIEHWESYGKKEGRYPNSYRGLVKIENSLPELLQLYRDIYQKAKPVPTVYDSSRDCALIFFETRKTPLFAPITRLFLLQAQGRANLYVYCTKANIDYFKSQLPEVEARYIVLDLPEQLNMDVYSALYKKESFWSHVKEEYLLTYQTDAFVFRTIPWDELIKSEYGWIGAWHYQHMFGLFDINTPKGVGMNGGLSFRRRSILLRCIQNITDTKINAYRNEHQLLPYPVEIPEDCYFYHAMEMLNIPLTPEALCNRFFIQDVLPLTLLQPTTLFGFHGLLYGNIDMYKFRRALSGIISWRILK